MKSKSMKTLVFGLTVLPAAWLLPGCSKTPGAPSVSFTAPLAATPANGTNYKFKEQPITLTITNAVRTGSATATYSVEVASDAGFANKVFTKDGIPEGGDGKTSVVVGSLSGGVTYYWRWKAIIDGVTGPASAAQQFQLAQQVVINPPAPVEPAGGSTVSQVRPAFTVTNSTRTGPAGTIFYDFQVSNSASFSTILASATVQEQGAQTTWTPSSDLPVGGIFWRARASDPANTETTSFTNPISFTLQPFDIKQVTFVNNPSDLATWTEGTKITSVVFTGDSILVDFDKRSGPGRWPESGFGIQYTLGMCFNISDHWYCSAVIQFWQDRELEASGQPHEIGVNWYYDGRWGIMNGHQPSFGEQVGIFVVQGNVRDNAGQSSLKERSDIVVLPFGGTYFRR